MRRIIKHSKRFRDYPKNVPGKLLKLFKLHNWSVSKLAQAIDINTGYISDLLNDGKEPAYKNTEARRKLFLAIRPICKTCGRRIFNRTIEKREKFPTPEFVKVWKHLPTAERQKVIQQYLENKEIEK